MHLLRTNQALDERLWSVYCVYQDAYLPVAHTCYFSLELPCYSSVEVMRRRLEYAMTEGVAIDLDHTVAATAAAWAVSVSDDERVHDH
jgi:hypothetical protein